MRATLTDAELTILSLLSEEPRHGYELEKVIEERGVRNWTALGFSSIYYVLDKLARRGLIETMGPVAPGKSRTTFRVTKQGHELCATAALDALTLLEPLHARVLIAMATSPGLAAADVVASLGKRTDALQAQLTTIRATRTQQEPLPTAAAAIFSYSEAMLLADLQWTEETLNAIMKERTMNKYDIKVAHKEFYSASSKDFTIVEVPTLQFLAVDGHGDPNTSPEYADAIEALYGVAYALKFESKKALARDFAVGPLEGLWRAADMAAFTERDKASWAWTMMISQPDWITEEMVATAITKVSAKKNLKALASLRLLILSEGSSVQIMHIGSYDDEAPTLEALHREYIPAQGLTFNGDHHEIYLNDARRTDSAKLKTILRQPVKPR